MTPQFEKRWLFPGLTVVKASKDSWQMSKWSLSNLLLSPSLPSFLVSGSTSSACFLFPSPALARRPALCWLLSSVLLSSSALQYYLQLFHFTLFSALLLLLSSLSLLVFFSFVFHSQLPLPCLPSHLFLSSRPLFPIRSLSCHCLNFIFSFLLFPTASFHNTLNLPSSSLIFSSILPSFSFPHPFLIPCFPLPLSRLAY